LLSAGLRIAVSIAAAVVLASSLAHAQTAAGRLDELVKRWQSTAPGHPLIGQMYKAEGSGLVRRDLWRMANPDVLISGGSPQTFLLLGEVHDNPEHHRAQALLMSALSASDAMAPTDFRPAVVMEMLTSDQAQSLADYLREPQDEISKLIGTARAERAAAVAAELGPAVAWEKTSWPAWPDYAPIAQAAIAEGRGLFAGDAGRSTIRSVVKGGLASVDADVRQRLRLETPLAPALATDLAGELRDSHCGMLPEQAIGDMADAQRYRDASLAESLAEAGAAGAVLIAGNGHVRSDRGVPWYLRQRVKGAAIVSIMLIEVEEGRSDPRAYVMRDPDGRPAADYFLFTPRHQRSDPCEQMRKAPAKKG
jgi:uncharacterized iron-regulated protein